MVTEFWKYEGAGNDFVLIDNRNGEFTPDTALVAALCHRRFGIGADGLMLLESEAGYDFRMRYYNSDGHEATMCGNGGRCIALLAEHLGIGGQEKLFIAADGEHSASVVERITPDRSIVSLAMIPVSGITEVANGLLLDTGSPHYVEFVTDIDSVDVQSRGRALRYNPWFLNIGGANINFVEVTGDRSLRIRTYERGVESETLACGTGAVASAIAAHASFAPKEEKFAVSTRGGELHVSFLSRGAGSVDDVLLVGPARRVFEGSFCVDNFRFSRS